MSLDMLLQILRTLKSFPTKVTLVRLEGNVDSNVGGDMITLDGGGATTSPLTSQVKIVCTFATDMTFADVLLRIVRYMKQV